MTDPSPAVPRSRRPALPTWLPVVVGNLLPIVAVATGGLGPGDVFVLYAVEFAGFAAVSVVMLRTARAASRPWTIVVDDQPRQLTTADDVTGAFGLVYAIVVGIAAALMIVLADRYGGVSGGPGWWLLTAVGLISGHLLSLKRDWFDRGAPDDTSPMDVNRRFVRRMVATVAVVTVVGVLFTGSADQPGVGAVALLCVLKTVVDVVPTARDARASGSH